MSGKRKAPQARDRVLGAQLRALRLSHTDLGVEEAAQAAQVSSATMSRTENGKRHITVEDIAVLCTLYGVPSVQRSALVDAAQAPTQDGWWEGPLPGAPMEVGTLASYESVATALTDWSMALIPGLLQTRAYAMGVLSVQGVDQSALDGYWKVRVHRQTALPRFDYVAYIHELALYTPFGGVGALKEQLVHLGHAADRGLGVRVVQARVPLAALAHPWLMLEFPKDEPILHVELFESAVHLHPPAVEPYLRARGELAAASLSWVESRKLIERLVERL
ncbi:helix-turn-helix domain-containing protein [Actinokineospora guangxiensis]|uniref:Helix-turn-helix domain-containing protein n=1 Tax=Actinokineospora guangxiensis TaxID=1490288 RepID=A0ABW0EUQ4_9PSEU